MFLISRIFLISFLFIPLGLLLSSDVCSAAEESAPKQDDAEVSEEDPLDNEATVQEEKPEPAPSALSTEPDQEEDDGKIDGLPKPHPDADAVLVFTKPALGLKTAGEGIELPAGYPVKVLIGFTHKGASAVDSDSSIGKELTLVAVDAAFRYPQDFSYYLQNMTASKFSRIVEPKRQATLDYAFIPALQLAGRPFGLTVRLHYLDSEGKFYSNAVFNDTVQVTEVDEGFDTEAFFLYVLIIAVLVVLAVAIYHLSTNYGTRKLLGKRSARPVEMGTSGNDDVDYDWIPKQHLEMQSRKSPHMSPRQRKVKRQENRGED